MKILTSKTVKYLLLAIPLILLIIFIILFVRTSNELYALKTECDKAIENYEKKIDELIAKNNINVPARKNDNPNNLNLSDFFIERFKEKGLSNPVQDIVYDLVKHTELIPYEAILGGAMHFYDREIWILNEKWVLAYFEDGHYSGYLLLEYTITDAGINWKRIAAMI